MLVTVGIARPAVLVGKARIDARLDGVREREKASVGCGFLRMLAVRAECKLVRCSEMSWSASIAIWMIAMR